MRKISQLFCKYRKAESSGNSKTIMAAFISEEFFKEEVDRQRQIFEVSNWIDLEEGELFLIQKMKNMKVNMVLVIYFTSLIKKITNVNCGLHLV